MTPEEKDLLLKDLCARLPYGVIVTNNSIQGELLSIEINIPEAGEIVYFRILSDSIAADTVSNIKPYLRPMSSMTEEEKKKLKADTCPEGTGYFDEKYLICPMNHFGEYISYEFMSDILEWLNSHHFDYRGLILMGLALEAPEGMYK